MKITSEGAKMYPLSSPQKNIWNLQKYYSESSISAINGLLIFDDRKNSKILEKSVNKFVENQEGIRLQLAEKGNDVYQYVSEYKYFEIPVIQFDDIDEAKDHFQNTNNKTIEMTNSVMYRFCIFLTPNQSGIFFYFNHIVADAWTASIFCKDIIKNYNLLLNGETISSEKYTYVDYIKSEKQYFTSTRYDKDREYWYSRFTKQPLLKKIKPFFNKSTTIISNRFTKTIPRDISNKIKTWCFNNNISIAVIFEAIIFSYLYKINEKSEER